MSDVRRTDEIQGEILHEYDGIEEADNRLPNWWLATFYGAILFGVGYWFYYHEFEVEPTTSEAYAAAAAEATVADVAEEAELVALAADPSAIAAGRETFATTCAACHGDRGQGVIGPNLTDSAWLHGGDPVSIYAAIRNGITSDEARIEGSAGMPGWGGQLGETRVRAVTAYLLSIRDTNEEGERGAEGDPYVPAGDAEGDDAMDAEEASAERDGDPAEGVALDEGEPDAANEDGDEASADVADDVTAEESDEETDEESVEEGEASDPE